MPSRGEVYYVEIPEREAQGHEQFGDRPWLIVSANHIHGNLDIVIAVPLTTKEKPNPQHRIDIPDADKIHEPGTSGWGGKTVALTEQIRVLDLSRFTRTKVGHIKPIGMAKVEAGIQHVLDLP
jgi:mRNA-degrading endonuclease toxin of MazEF toxin-antitoxin module